jgi:manganese transport protein
VAIVPAVLVAAISGDSGTNRLLILSQVILSFQLSFAVFPLVAFTSDKAKMGTFVNAWYTKALAYAIAAFIAGINVWLVVQAIRGGVSSA